MLCTMTSIGWTRNSSQTHSGTRNVCIESAQRRQVSLQQQPRGNFQATTTLRIPFWNCSLTPQVFCIFIICSPPRPITKPTRDLGTWSYKTKERAITWFSMYRTLFCELPLSYQASLVKDLQCILVPGTKQKRTLSSKCKKCLSNSVQKAKYEIWNTSAIWAEAFFFFPQAMSVIGTHKIAHSSQDYAHVQCCVIVQRERVPNLPIWRCRILMRYYAHKSSG